MFLSSYRNMSESLGEWEMLWEHQVQVGVSTAFFSSPKHKQVILLNMQIMSLNSMNWSFKYM